jgi:hypothetical protein
MKRVALLIAVAALGACATATTRGDPKGLEHIQQFGKGTFTIIDITSGSPGQTVAWAYNPDDSTGLTYWAFRTNYWGNDAPSTAHNNRQWQVTAVVPEPTWTSAEHFAYWAKSWHPDPDGPMTFRTEKRGDWDPQAPNPQPPPPAPPPLGPSPP